MVYRGNAHWVDLKGNPVLLSEINVEEVEETCRVSFANKFLRPARVISWDEKYIYFKNNGGYYHRTELSPFIDCLNYTRGFMGDYDKPSYPILREAIINIYPPEEPSECNDNILIQNFGMFAVAGIFIRDALKVFTRKKR
jgi:hypothetical protein